MEFPYINLKKIKVEKSTKATATFGGLNQNLSIGENEFSDMQNITSKYYPSVATRKPRSASSTSLTKANGLYYKNGLFVIDGTNVKYNGNVISGFTVADSKKELVGMGAYILIFPDKKYFNTADTTKFGSMEKSMINQSATFAPLSQDSAFTKITVSGIDDIFNTGDGVKISGLTNVTYKDIFNGQTKVVTDKGDDYIVVTGKIAASFSETACVNFATEIPTMDYVCECNNRLWGCSSANHEIYASKLGDFWNFNVFEGTSQDSYAMTVGSDGNFTGCIGHLGHPVFFKENQIHMIYGDKPSNFSINSKTLPGVRSGCEHSLCIVNETLYYVAQNGVCSFDGGVPTKISYAITEPITEAVTSQEDSMLYMSCKLNGVQTLLTYNPQVQLWEKEDGTKFDFACYGNGQLHYISSNVLSTINGTSTNTIVWFLESGDIIESSLDEKWISKLKFNFMLAKGSQCNIFVKFDDEPTFKQVGEIHSKSNRTYTIPIVPQRCNKYRYRIEGAGEFKLLGISREVEYGSEINGGIQFRR